MISFIQNRVMKGRGVVSDLRETLGTECLLSEPSACAAYAVRGMAEHGAVPSAVVFARTTEDIQSTLEICNRYNVPVVPRGAGTNLSCAIATSTDTVLLCTSRMRAIKHFDPIAGTICVEAGVRNQAITDHVESCGWHYSPDPSSRRNCTIGGNIATNSGGSSCLRSGVTANHVAALKVVLYDGTVLEAGGESYDAPGLGLATMICGSEGRIGIVAEAVLRLTPTAPARMAAVIALDTSSKAVSIAEDLLASGIAPAQMDYLDANATEMCARHSSIDYPITAGGIVLLDLTGRADQLTVRLKKIQAIAEHHKLAVDFFNAAKDAAGIWLGRERIYGAAARVSRYVTTDIAVPLSNIDRMLDAIQPCVDAYGLRHASTAHLGDGTIHSFIFFDRDCTESLQRAEDCATDIRRIAIGYRGTSTSEYGLGTRHRHLLKEQFSATDLCVQDRCVGALKGITEPLTDSADMAALSLQQYTNSPGVVHHDPSDQTITVHAGTVLNELAIHLRKHSQALTFDVTPSNANLTLQAALDSNLPTPRRPFSGSVRDAVLATRFTTGIGEEISTGAKVLKNVAGLDISRVIIGAERQLGILREVTLRVVPDIAEQTIIVHDITPRDFPQEVVTWQQAGYEITGAAYLSAEIAADNGVGTSSVMLLRLTNDCDLPLEFNQHFQSVNLIDHELAQRLWDRVCSGPVLSKPARGEGDDSVSVSVKITCSASTGGKIAARFDSVGAAVAMDWRGALVWARLATSQARSLLQDVLRDYPDASLSWHSGRSVRRNHEHINLLKPALDPLGRFKPVSSLLTCHPRHTCECRSDPC